jgi:UDP-glucose 4-epimerase
VIVKPIAVVTGGAGFIGSHLVDLLLDHGFAVRVIDNLTGGRASNLEHRSGDANLVTHWVDIRHLEPSSAIFSGSQYVFHLAGIGDIVPSIEKPIEYMDVNVLGTVCALECARSTGVEKFVFAASSSCYGDASTPTGENHPIDPRYPDALSKYQGEQAAFHWHRLYQLPVNSVCIEMHMAHGFALKACTERSSASSSDRSSLERPTRWLAMAPKHVISST